MQSEVRDMTCGGCANAITRAVSGIDLAAKVEMDVTGGRSTCLVSDRVRSTASILDQNTLTNVGTVAASWEGETIWNSRYLWAMYPFTGYVGFGVPDMLV